jgi:hypothetical protein
MVASKHLQVDVMVVIVVFTIESSVVAQAIVSAVVCCFNSLPNRLHHRCWQYVLSSSIVSACYVAAAISTSVHCLVVSLVAVWIERPPKAVAAVAVAVAIAATSAVVTVAELLVVTCVYN